MKKIIIIILLVNLLTTNLNAQDWIKHADSVYTYFKINDDKNALKHIRIVDSIIELNGVIKDTNFAEYLYRKGVVMSSIGDSSSNQFLINSLNIWENSIIKNNLKIAKIYHFLGIYYFSKINSNNYTPSVDTCYRYYENAYNIIANNHLEYIPNYKSVLNALIYINQYKYKNKLKANFFAQQYIEVSRTYGSDMFDFNFSDAYRIISDLSKEEALLIKYLTEYNTKSIQDPNLQFKIYYKLFNNKRSIIKNGEVVTPLVNLKNIKDIIDYGEQAINIFKKNHLTDKYLLEDIYVQLMYSYEQILDNTNSVKYKILSYELNERLEPYDKLNYLYYTNDLKEFKIEYELQKNNFLKSQNYSELISILKYAVILFEKGLIFKQNEIQDILDILISNALKLENEDQVLLDKILCEFYFFINNKELSFKISSKHINDEISQDKLFYLRVNALSNLLFNNIFDAQKNADTALDNAFKLYGENDPRCVPFLTLMADCYKENSNQKIALKSISNAINILYQNKLEKTELAADVWNNAGNLTLSSNNLEDAEIYFKKALDIYELNGITKNPYYYYSVQLKLCNIYTSKGDYNNAKILLDSVNKYIESKHLLEYAKGDYFSSLAFYYFFLDEFNNAKIYFDKAKLYYQGYSINKNELYSIMCDYLIDNDAKKAIQKYEKIVKSNLSSFGAEKLYYLLLYNSGKKNEAKSILLNHIDKLIDNNNQFIHLLNNKEKYDYYNTISNDFEFLNTYLLDSNVDFLKQYIDYRIYSKTFLTAGIDSVKYNNEIDLELKKEFISNSIKINELLERKNEGVDQIVKLRFRNNEIEKLNSNKKEQLNSFGYKELILKLKADEAYVEIIRINKQSINKLNVAKNIINYFTDSIYYGAIIISNNKDPQFILINNDGKLDSLYAKNYSYNIKNKILDTNSYSLLFEKIDEKLVGKTKIYLVTDGVYSSFNLEAIFNPRRKKYVIEYLKIQTIINLQSFTSSGTEFIPRENSTVSIFGHPSYRLKSSIIKTENNEILNLSRSIDNLNLFKDIKINNLSGTKIETDSISKILRESKFNIYSYTENEATEENIKLINSPDILHIATHGFFIKNDDKSYTLNRILNLFNDKYKHDPYLRSGLLFSGAENSINGSQIQGSENGILTAEESKGLKLNNTNLVVLSACETGIGDYQVGKGIIGLQSAFFIAGAKNLIMSLWPVNDIVTKDLMTKFYSNWIRLKMSKEAALLMAKNEIKNIYPEPFYWAGFVLVK